jgi:hypothetical protein
MNFNADSSTGNIINIPTLNQNYIGLVYSNVFQSSNVSTSNYASNVSNVIIRNTSNYASNVSNVIITNTSNYASNVSNVIITNTSNYASNVSNVIITNTSNYASNVSNVIIRNTTNYASNVSNVIITNTSNYASNVSNVIIRNTSNYASNVSNVIITSLNTNINNTSNYASNVSNVIIRNTSNYSSNVSNVIIRNTSNYSSNISNVIIINTSNYASNVSNILLSEINTITAGIRSELNGTIDNEIKYSSNYASNVSNILLSEMYTINTSILSELNGTIDNEIKYSSNYASNISNVISSQINSINSINESIRLEFNTLVDNEIKYSSNYASNISNVIIISLNTNVNINNTSNYASNISNVIIRNTSNYASNISNVIITNTSNYASNVSNVIIRNTSNYASNVSNVIIINTSNYASNISNVLLTTFKYNSPISTDVNNIISLNLDNKSVIQYPPEGMSSATPPTIFKNSSYGNNGIYTVLSSTTTNMINCFNYNEVSEWTGTTLYRATAPFDYTSTSVNTIINGTSNIYGDWVQLYYDKGFVATSISIICLQSSLNNSPSAFVLAASIDGVNWTLLSQQSGITTVSNTFNINNYTSYNYYRLIITNTIGATIVKITEIKFFGLPNTTYVNNDNFNQIIYNTTEKQFPPRIYDIVTTEVTYTPSAGNELFGLLPTSIFRQIITLNNHGTYTLYSSSTTSPTANQFKNELFKFDNSIAFNGAFWASGNYSAGVYNNTNRSIKGSYYGDWIIVKFPFKIVLTRFRFYNNNSSIVEATLITNINKAPGLWKCYGSNDGINFTEITEAGNFYRCLTVNNYSLGYYEDIIPSTFDIPYLYIGWVINALVGSTTSDAAAIFLNFQELQIFGKDDISNSYSKALTLLPDNRLIYNNTSNIITYTSTTSSVNLTNKYVRFNYDDEVYINSGTYNLTFTAGYHRIDTSTEILKYTYPILKDSSSNIINPLIWYKFDTNPGLLIDNGSLNNGNLTNYTAVSLTSTINTFKHGTSSASFAGGHYLIVPNTINLNAINVLTGISFSFWVFISGITGSNGRIFDFGQLNGSPTTTGTNYITIFCVGTDYQLGFEINTNGTSSTFTSHAKTYGGLWHNLTWTISITGVWTIYINGYSLSGTLSGAARVIPELLIANRTYYIGKSLFSAAGSLTMRLDDFRIYGKELSAIEVIELYNGRVEVYTKNNIGIGITNPNPNYILDVNGNTNISGIITSSSFSGNGSLITNINYNNITTNKLSFATPLSSNINTNEITIDLTSTSNYASNISNVIIRNTSNYASNVSNVIITNTSNYASNVSNVIITNTSNYASNVSNVIITNTSNYASNVSNVIIRNTSNYASNISNVIITNSSNYASNVSNVIIRDSSNFTLASINNLITNDNITFSGNIRTKDYKKIIFNSLPPVGNTVSFPALSELGNDSIDRIILSPGSSSAYPFSIGASNIGMWFSVPGNDQFMWYSNGNMIMNLNEDGILNVKNDIVAFASLSDRRLKTNICNLSINCLDLINTIKSVEFNWKDSYRIPDRKRNTRDHGFIAQDIEEILPNLVNNDGEYKSLKYEKFAPYLVKGIQELYKIVQDQQEEINEIKSKLNL